ncbi:MAG: glycosyltransferase family 1 protein [Planctomycetes bacterium]|nr:glycosyltransferase family 1 protein [Planctomycetota bacterium]
MPGRLYIPPKFVSRYSLLDAMSAQIARAFAQSGWRVNPPPGSGPALFILLNFPANIQELWRWIRETTPDDQVAILHFFVDHPLALFAPHIDALAARADYRMLLPCRDDAHLLRLRWPTLRHMTCPHGVPPEALCDPETLEAGYNARPDEPGARPIPLLIAGSIHSAEEIAALHAQLPAPIHPVCDDIVAMQMRFPHMPFSQAFDLALTPGMVSPDHWQLLTAIWRYTTASLNRERRLSILSAMQGVPTAVVGPQAWAPHCSGSIEYKGEVPYQDLPAVLVASRVCLAWGPTQFTHSYSERLLLSLAAGCATLADDRLAARAEFGDVAAFFPADRPAAAREQVEALLSDPSLSYSLAFRGRDRIAERHLWSHRLQTFLAVARDVCPQL